ncbi:uncharacterized protein J3R85_003828 [Psidium guajava]|nr:uncharacterized protein J3R85_003828 [Psidium guajava]
MTKQKVPTFFLIFSRTNSFLSWSLWIEMACSKRKLHMLHGCFFCAAQAPLSSLSLTYYNQGRLLKTSRLSLSRVVSCGGVGDKACI